MLLQDTKPVQYRYRRNPLRMLMTAQQGIPPNADAQPNDDTPPNSQIEVQESQRRYANR